MSTPRFYRWVPPAVYHELESFRASHPYRTALVRGTEWRYLTSGEGESILLFPGTSCTAEVGWRTIQGLEKGFRVVSPDYPALGSNSDLAAGVLGILDREGIRKIHVMGGSAGGLTAQYFLRHHPDRVTSLILANTVVPRRETGMHLARRLVALRRLPEWMVRWFLILGMRGLIPIGRGPAVALFWGHFREIVWTQLSRSRIIALLERSAEIAATQELGPPDSAAWTGRVLLILSEDDPATPEAARHELMARYPAAVVKRFQGSGHVTSTLEPDRFVGAVEEFLRSPG